MHPWKKLENQNGIPFYINEISKEKQWDHPKFSYIRQQVDDCNYIRYSSYRVALKFRTLQQALWMDQVPLTVVAGVFERHKLGTNECGLNLDCYDLEAILFDIFFACNKQNQGNIDVDTSTELMLNLLINVYDRGKSGKVPVLSAKLLLGILSNSSLSDLFRFLFEVSADHNNCITRLKVQILLKKITEIINFMHEDASFGQHLISSATDNCFKDSPGLVGITESLFILWLEKGPSILSWLPILFRIKQAETVLHNCICSSCKNRPFVGLRYRCLKCTNYIQCQRCFLSAKTTNSHKLSHSMREYSTEVNEKENHILINKILGILTCLSKKPRSSVTIVDAKPSGEQNEIFSGQSENDDTICDMAPSFSPLSQLQLIIRQLEQQNKNLNSIISSKDHNSVDIKMYLETHRLQVSKQINKLKLLKDSLKLPPSSVSSYEKKSKTIVQSTPLVSNSKSRLQGMQIGVLSPINQLHENSVPLQDTISEGIDSKSRDYTYDLNPEDPSTLQYSLNDISTWIDKNPSQRQILNDGSNRCQGRKMHTDLDDALAKLQQILANNLVLDESLDNYDNGQLKYAVSEVEGMLTSFIDTVETTRTSSVQQNQIPNKF